MGAMARPSSSREALAWELLGIRARGLLIDMQLVRLGVATPTAPRRRRSRTARATSSIAKVGAGSSLTTPAQPRPAVGPRRIVRVGSGSIIGIR
jgi:hypothetical protein